MFSTGFSSGERDGSRMMVILAGSFSLPAQVPSGPVHEDDGMGPFCHCFADFIEMKLHGMGVGFRHHDGSARSPCRADSAE